MTANPTASIANEISTIAAATESYLGFVDLIFGNDEVIAVEGKNRGDKNAEKAAKAYEKDGENPDQAKKDLKAKSINNGKVKEAGYMTKTVLKEKKLGESLKELLEKIKEFFMSLFGKKIPSTALVPFVKTEPNLEEMLQNVNVALENLCHNNSGSEDSVEQWKHDYEVFKQAVQDLGTRLSKCHEEIAANAAKNKEMRAKKVNIGKQLRTLESLNRDDVKDVKNLEAIQKELAKVYTAMARYYNNPTVKRFLLFGTKELSAEDLRKKSRGVLGYKEATTKGNIKEAQSIIRKNVQRTQKYNDTYGTSDNG